MSIMPARDEPRRLYERTGVSEYWVVDSEIEAIRVYRRAGDTFERPEELSRERDDILRTPILEGLDLPLASIFRRP